ncbi:MAG: hypothetical protein ABRQ37_03150 [Candidatus Eremiobacterota bacterium]
MPERIKPGERGVFVFGRGWPLKFHNMYLSMQRSIINRFTKSSVIPVKVRLPVVKNAILMKDL